MLRSLCSTRIASCVQATFNTVWYKNIIIESLGLMPLQGSAALYHWRTVGWKNGRWSWSCYASTCIPYSQRVKEITRVVDFDVSKVNKVPSPVMNDDDTQLLSKRRFRIKLLNLFQPPRNKVRWWPWNPSLIGFRLNIGPLVVSSYS
jgi:hypothetical protein